jgi:aryl-alcohol dehydrogenase-like predicted oxidoreductase
VAVVIDRVPFGSTGHRSSRVIFGAAALSAMSQDRSDVTLAIARRFGINHIDTAADYGESELRLAPFLAERRGEVFLASKTGERSGDRARAQLERSLERMGVGHVDLIQLHNLVEEEDWRTAFSPGGAVEALFQARTEGLCRHVGVTGHGLRIARMHLRSLAEAPFASVLFPWNHGLAAVGDYAADIERLRSVCVERGIAMQTIKSVARRRWDDLGARQFSWYEPIPEGEALDRAVAFVLSQPDLFLSSSSDARLLEATCEAASGPAIAPSPEQLTRDREDLGITPLFDGDRLDVI